MMKCEICEKDSGDYAILPIKRENGSLETIACIQCAEKSLQYCKFHERPHLGFEDETSACILCIEETVKLQRSRVHEIVEQIRKDISEETWEELKEAADTSSVVIGDPYEVSIVRFIATKALRESISFDDIFNRILARHSVNFILH